MRWLVVLTGAAGSGCSTIASGLVDQAHTVQLRTFAHPDFTGGDPAECDIMARRPQSARIAWSGSTDGVLHGMLNAEISRVPTGGVGVVVVHPALLPELDAFRAAQPDWEIVTIGLDTIHNVAEQPARLQNSARRGDTVQSLAEIRKRLAAVDVRLEGSQAVVESAAQAVCRLIVSRGGMLTRDLLKPLFDAGSVLTNLDAASLKSASYDLRLGDEAWCGGFIDLTANEPFLEIPPYSYAIVKAMERAALPTFMAGQFDLRVSFFLSGIILSNGPQVDPGYRGDLFCMLFNGNSEPHRMRMGDRFCTIQFMSTARVCDTYAGDYSIKEKLRRSMPPNAVDRRGKGTPVAG
jgi:deoxycytidine triphosphate deaminase